MQLQQALDGNPIPRYCNIGHAYENVDIIDLSVDVEVKDSLGVDGADAGGAEDGAAAASAAAATAAAGDGVVPLATPFSYQVFNWTQPDVPNPGGDVGRMNGRAAGVMDAPVPVNNAGGDVNWSGKSYLRFGETQTRTAADVALDSHWMPSMLTGVMGAHHPGGVPTIARWVEADAIAEIESGGEPTMISVLMFLLALNVLGKGVSGVIVRVHV
jgi:hypothetical protein